MENDINKWANLWHQQKADNLDIDLLTKQLNNLDRITKFQKLLFLFASVFLIYSMFTHLPQNVYNTISFDLIILGFLIILVPLFGNKPNFKIKNTNQFIENQIRYLRKKLLLPRVYFLIFILFFVLALNIGFWGASYKLDISYRILFHFSSIILFVFLLIVRKAGMKNYEKEILPLIENLEQIKKQE